jgi:hypothetical protein
MRVVVEGNSGIRMAELSLRNLGRGACFEEKCGVHVPEGMKARPVVNRRDCRFPFPEQIRT